MNKILYKRIPTYKHVYKKLKKKQVLEGIR
jgi:hypothetical protein